MSARFLDDVIRSFEGRLAGSPLELRTLDAVDIPKALPDTLAHRGFGVSCPESPNTGAYRDRNLARVSDRIVVTLTYRVNPKQQRASARAAMLLEEQVRAHLTEPAWEPDLHIAYQTATRGPHPQSSEWWLTTIVFTASRDARLGG